LLLTTVAAKSYDWESSPLIFPVSDWTKKIPNLTVMT